MHQDQKLSLLVKRQLPEFIQDQHENFVAFLEAYFEWMEMTQGAVDALKNIPTYRNIDNTLPAFVDFFRKEFLEGIPTTTLADKRLLVKHIKDFYLTKGSDNSIRLLFRILFNEDVQIYYPGDDLLRASDGKWVVDYTIKTQGNVNTADFKGRIITGQSSGATATVEYVEDFSTFLGDTVKEVFLNKSTIKGTFLNGETVSTVNAAGVTITDVILPIIIEPTIVTAGTGYVKGDTFAVKYTDSNGPQIVATGTVKTINALGGILTVKLDNFPVNEAGLGTLSVDFTASGDGNATGTVNYGVVATYNGRWLDNDGKLSEDKKLQDNFYYQDFSYVLRSTVPIDTFKDLIEKSAHPAGMLAFAEVLQTEGSLQSVIVSPAVIAAFLTVIEEVNAYTRYSSIAANPFEVELNLEELLTFGSIAVGDLMPTQFYGWRTSPVNDNPAYENELHKYKFSDIISRPIERGLFAPPSSEITITT